MRTIFLASAAALALGLGGTALIAQDVVVSTTTGTTLSIDQQTMYQGWPVDQRTSYDAWPAPYQGYYWTITPNQQTAWWRLNDEQRTQIFVMAPEQRVVAWNSIEAQLAAAPPATITYQVQANPVGSSAPPTATPPNPQVAAAPVAPAMPADPSYNAGPYKGALTAPPAEAMNKVYPLCTRTLQDSCRNPGSK